MTTVTILAAQDGCCCEIRFGWPTASFEHTRQRLWCESSRRPTDRSIDRSIDRTGLAVTCRPASAARWARLAGIIQPTASQPSELVAKQNTPHHLAGAAAELAFNSHRRGPMLGCSVSRLQFVRSVGFNRIYLRYKSTRRSKKQPMPPPPDRPVSGEDGRPVRLGPFKGAPLSRRLVCKLNWPSLDARN